MTCTVGWLALSQRFVLAIVLFTGSGEWPDSWPASMEAFRHQSSSAYPATGDDIQEDWFQITLKSAEEMDRLWPALLQLLDRGSVITLRPIGLRREYFGSPDWGYSDSVVRIFAPPRGPFGYPPGVDRSGRKISSERYELWHRTMRNEQLTETESRLLDIDSIQEPIGLDLDAMQANNGRWLTSGPPWPDGLRDESGNLPELVHPEDVSGRMTWVAGPYPGRSHGIRCRIDLEIVVDGRIVDPAQLSVPDYVTLVDERPGSKARN